MRVHSLYVPGRHTNLWSTLNSGISATASLQRSSVNRKSLAAEHIRTGGVAVISQRVLSLFVLGVHA